jgi:hypothetical protein
MRPLPPSLTIMAAACLASGCNSRGAEDRVVSQRQREANHGPAYVTMAYRPVDKARWSNGTIIINESGLEPVYVGAVGVNRVDEPFAQSRADDSSALLDRLDRLDARLKSPETSPAAPAAAPSASPAEGLKDAQPVPPTRSAEPSATVEPPATAPLATASEAPLPAASPASAPVTAATTQAISGQSVEAASVANPSEPRPAAAEVQPVGEPQAPHQSEPAAPPKTAPIPFHYQFSGRGRRP